MKVDPFAGPEFDIKNTIKNRNPKNDPFAGTEFDVKKQDNFVRKISKKDKTNYAKEENPFWYGIAEQANKVPYLMQGLEGINQASKVIGLTDLGRGALNEIKEKTSPLRNFDMGMEGLKINPEHAGIFQDIFNSKELGPEYGGGGPMSEIGEQVGKRTVQGLAGRGVFGAVNAALPRANGYLGLLGDMLQGGGVGYALGDIPGAIAGAIGGPFANMTKSSIVNRIHQQGQNFRRQYNNQRNELVRGAEEANAPHVERPDFFNRDMEGLLRKVSDNKLSALTRFWGEPTVANAITAKSDMGALAAQLRSQPGKLGFEREAMREARRLERALRENIRQSLRNSENPRLARDYNEFNRGYQRDVIPHQTKSLKEYAEALRALERSNGQGHAGAAVQKAFRDLLTNTQFQSGKGGLHPEMRLNEMAGPAAIGAGIGGLGVKYGLDALKGMFH